MIRGLGLVGIAALVLAAVLVTWLLVELVRVLVRRSRERSWAAAQAAARWHRVVAPDAEGNVVVSVQRSARVGSRTRVLGERVVATISDRISDAGHEAFVTACGSATALARELNEADGFTERDGVSR